MSRPIVLICDRSVRPEAEQILSQTCEVRYIDGYPPEDKLIEALRGAVGMIARLVQITPRTLEVSKDLRIVACHGVGVDRLDLARATELGIVVTTTGSANAAAVAEYTVALLLGLWRKVPRADGDMRTGAWTRNPLIGGEMEGKTLGIIGLGAIGKRVARQALGFRMRVIAYDPNVPAAPADLDVQMVPLDKLLAESDVVSLHPRLNDGNYHMIGAKQFAAMKPTATVINTARGELIDEVALIDALRGGRIAAAAIDVFNKEPLPADSPLRKMENVLLSPHVAGQTPEALVRIAQTAGQQLLDEIAGKQPRYVYNPEVYDIRKKLAAEGRVRA